MGHDGVSVAGGVAPYPRLVGDVGGTGARFGWIAAAGAPLVALAAASGPPAPDLAATIRAALEANGLAAPASCALGIAAAVTGDRVVMTNREWSFSTAALRHSLGVARLLVLNDFSALGHAIDTLRPDDVHVVGGGRAVPDATVALLGPGTGLGVGGLVRAPEGTAALVGEGGHGALAAGDEREAKVIALLRERFDHVSAEHVLSGPGLARLHDAVCALDGRPAEPLDAPRIVERAGTDPACRDTLRMFFAFLGAFAGDLALTLGARGGVYVAGGIVARLGVAIDHSAFRERFEAKGRRRAYLEAIPTAVILDTPALALRGADAALSRLPA
ncbi:MAG: glucokinase [Caldimonas sp.]